MAKLVGDLNLAEKHLKRGLAGRPGPRRTSCASSSIFGGETHAPPDQPEEARPHAVVGRFAARCARAGHHLSPVVQVGKEGVDAQP